MSARILASVCIAAVALAISAVPCRAQSDRTALRFDFGGGPVAPGHTQVLPTHIYSPETSFGFEPGGAIVALDRSGNDPLDGDFCTSERPFYFSVKLPEGNYNITLTLRDRAR